jgi:hypothetical protein
VSDGFWYILAICLLLGAVALGAWALFWDRSRGRLRCPKCQYRMEGIAASTVERRGKSLTGHVCPECGFVAARESELRRTRRRWRAVAVAGLMLLGSHVASYMPAVQERSYRALIPTWVLVTVWPMSDLMEDPAANSFWTAGQGEVMVRREEHWPGWLERRWVRRLLRDNYYETDPDGRYTSFTERVYDLRDLWEPLRFNAAWYQSPEELVAAMASEASDSPLMDAISDDDFTRRGWEDVYTLELKYLVEDFVDSDQWETNGGYAGFVVGDVSHIAAFADTARLDRIGRFLDDLEQTAKRGVGASTTCDYLNPLVVIYNVADLRGQTNDTGENHISQVVEKSCQGLRYQVLRGAIVIAVRDDQACVELFEAELARVRAEASAKPE